MTYFLFFSYFVQSYSATPKIILVWQNSAGFKGVCVCTNTRIGLSCALLFGVRWDFHLDSTRTMVAMQFSVQPGRSHVSERLLGFVTKKKQLSTTWKQVQLDLFWTLISESDRGAQVLLQGTGNRGKINLCIDISRSSSLDGNPTVSW